MQPSSISGVNRLPETEKRELFSKVLPVELIERFHLRPGFYDDQGNDLIHLDSRPESSTVAMSLFHQHGFPDPVFYGQLTDTLNGQVHILLYILNDPESPRFNVDVLPDGTLTKFGILHRNIQAELDSMEFGLAPGQVRRGLRLLQPAIAAFERFVQYLGHDMYFVEPLYYHNAIIFEQYGFSYTKGRKLMERIQQGLIDNGDLLPLLDGSTPFRSPQAATSIRLRSWAIHDGILGEPFNNVTMYKQIGKSAGLSTCGGCAW